MDEEKKQSAQEPENQISRDGATARVLGFSKRTKIIFGVLAAGAVIALTVGIALQYITPHYSVAELVTRPVTPEGQFVAVEGVLVSNSYVQSADGLVSTFRLTDEDGSDTIRITYGLHEGADVGQLFFNEHSTIFVQGRKVSPSEFEATRLTVKCPTKYQTGEEAYEGNYTSDA